METHRKRRTKTIRGTSKGSQEFFKGLVRRGKHVTDGFGQTAQVYLTEGVSALKVGFRKKSSRKAANQKGKFSMTLRSKR